MPATKIAWLVLREAKTLGYQLENVVAVDVIVVVSVREGLHDLLVEVAGSAAVGASKPEAELVGDEI